ncbi:HNH endonuclease family protein [Terrabacter sp. 2RAF25]|uniref:HNH endonuclease family protein n=1 Tax=Terrabacter sp. 2RAF25 TaxID=3232998 RepID=UPI003F980EDA
MGNDRAPKASLLGWGGLTVCALLGLTSGVGGALLFAGLFTFVVAAVALARGRVRWAHLASRSSGVAALVASIAAMSIGVANMPAVPISANPTPAQSASPSAAPADETLPTSSTPVDRSAVATPSQTVTTTIETDPLLTSISSAPPGSALAMVGTLLVRGRGPMTGYSRAAFGAAWTDVDRNGCDQRNDTLRRDLRAITVKADTNGCAVMTGTLKDPYTGATLAFARTARTSTVQIDHVVALADAWAKGAAGWPQSQRTAFANDTLNLVAVSSTVNASKGGGDAATWLPPAKAYRCAYVARQVAVKAKYHLAVTHAERVALATTLSTCVDTTPPVVTVAKLGGFPLYSPPAPKPAPKPAPNPTPKPVVKPAPKPAPQPSKPAPEPAGPSRVQGVRPGSFCSPEGALGYTNKGTLMRCSYKSGDTRARWRSA